MTVSVYSVETKIDYYNLGIYNSHENTDRVRVSFDIEFQVLHCYLPCTTHDVGSEVVPDICLDVGGMKQTFKDWRAVERFTNLLYPMCH